MTVALAICLSQVSAAQGGHLSERVADRSKPTRVVPVSTPPRSEKCPSARRAVAYYRAHTHQRQSARGGTLADRTPIVSGKSCRWARHAADTWKARAHSAGKALERWQHQYAWWLWLPAKHQRVASCETGHQGGDGPGGSRWDWDSGTYVSAFGIYRQGYDDDARRIGNLGWDETIRELGRYPTPREQMQAADSHRAAHGGWSGWGCRGA